MGKKMSRLKSPKPSSQSLLEDRISYWAGQSYVAHFQAMLIHWPDHSPPLPQGVSLASSPSNDSPPHPIPQKKKKKKKAALYSTAVYGLNNYFF